MHQHRTDDPAAPGTRESLLDAAEELFAERGIPAASLRAITERATANLAAVHYHFGSKQGLVRAVFDRRLAPLNRERLALLERCEAEGGGVDGVVRAFVAPIFLMAKESHESAFAQMMARAYSEPSEEVREIVASQFSELVDRFVQALARRLPELPEAEVYWRLLFVAGAMAHTVSCGHLLAAYSRGRCAITRPEEAIDHLVSFLAAGFRAAAPDSASRKENEKGTLRRGH
jgi:AcrR family transcriptional regulator